MAGSWRRFASLPDRERARRVAWVAASIMVLLLYALGGLSLFLRQRYLSEPANIPATLTPDAPGVVGEAAATPTVPPPTQAPAHEPDPGSGDPPLTPPPDGAPPATPNAVVPEASDFQRDAPDEPAPTVEATATPVPDRDDAEQESEGATPEPETPTPEAVPEPAETPPKPDGPPPGAGSGPTGRYSPDHEGASWS